MKTTEKERQTSAATAVATEQPTEDTTETYEEVPNHIDEAKSQVQVAYLGYLEAQRKVANACKQLDQRDQEVYKDAELKAYKVYEEEIARAANTREKAEQEAEEAYNRAKEKATQNYHANVSQALTKCKETIDKAWKDSKKNSEQIWTLFQNHKQAS